MRSFIGLFNIIGSRLTKRQICISSDLPFAYLAGVGFRYLFSLVRSLKYIPYRNIAAGRIFVEENVSIACKSRVKIDPGTRLGKDVFIDGYGRLGVRLGAGCSIGAYTRIICSGSITSQGLCVSIGNRVGIGEYSRIGGSGGVEIGDDTIIAQYFSAHPENHNFSDKTTPIRSQGTTKSPIKIGRNCWIGAKVTVTAGVSIGDGAVIGSGAVVVSDIPSYSVAVGVPARVVKEY